MSTKFLPGLEKILKLHQKIHLLVTKISFHKYHFPNPVPNVLLLFLLGLSKLSVCVQGKVIDRLSAVDAPDGAVPSAVAAEGAEDEEVGGEDDGRQKK